MIFVSYQFCNNVTCENLSSIGLLIGNVRAPYSDNTTHTRYNVAFDKHRFVSMLSSPYLLHHTLETPINKQLTVTYNRKKMYGILR